MDTNVDTKVDSNVDTALNILNLMSGCYRVLSATFKSELHGTKEPQIHKPVGHHGHVTFVVVMFDGAQPIK